MATTLALRLIFFGIFIGQVHGVLRLASYYGDHMVLQRGPQQAVVWGTASVDGSLVTARILGQGSAGGSARGPGVTARVLGGKWKVALPAMTDPGPFQILFSSTEGDVTLNDVLFGDVWLCSGQSNMEFEMKKVMNSTAELENAKNFSNIRFMSSSYTKSDTPMDTLDVMEHWAAPTSQTLREFSAVCFLFAESLLPHLGHPLGLVESSWGGTSIEAWSPPEALARCPVVTHGQEPPCCPHAPQVLWNSKISPLLEMTIFGALWYQGETNADHPAEYSCQMQALVSEWRRQFHAQSLNTTRPDFPFGYVQLAAYVNASYVGGFPQLRWSQTADHGYSPNPDLPNTFMAVAMDLPDYTSPFNPIHPRYKQDVAQRLAAGALHVAYGRSDVSFQGPFPSSFTRNVGSHTLRVEYDHGATPLDIRSVHGFEVCCDVSGRCDSTPYPRWEAAPMVHHDASSVTLSYASCGQLPVGGLRYAWRTSPCGFKQCAVYAADSGLPAPPYITLSPPA